MTGQFFQAYNVKKEVSKLTRPVPLMYVDSPPVHVRISITEEESTSIFVAKESPTFKRDEIVIPQVNPIIERKLKKIQTSFGMRLYQPLTLKLKDDQEIFGTIKKIEGNEILLHLDDEDQTIEVAAHEIVDIMWRGKSLSER